MLCEDLTGDGIADIYLGGGRNQQAILLIGKPDGSFERSNNPDFDQDARYEDTDAVTIDFDGDAQPSLRLG